MADRSNIDMLILEFLSITKPSRRHEVKNDLTHSRNTTTASFTHDSASRSSPFSIYCRSYVTQFIITWSVYDDNLGTSKDGYFYEWHCNGVCWHAYACPVGLLAPPFSQCWNSSQRVTLAGMRSDVTSGLRMFDQPIGVH